MGLFGEKEESTRCPCYCPRPLSEREVICAILTRARNHLAVLRDMDSTLATRLEQEDYINAIETVLARL